MNRYQVEYTALEPGAQYAIVDTARSPNPADRGGLVLGDIYVQDVAEKIVSLLNGEQVALDAKEARIKELEDVRHNWATALSDTELSDPEYMRGYVSDFGMDIRRLGEYIKNLKAELNRMARLLHEEERR